MAGRESCEGGVKDLPANSDDPGCRGGDGIGVRKFVSVIFSRNVSICLRVRALCNVSKGRILGTFQPSQPVQKGREAS